MPADLPLDPAQRIAGVLIPVFALRAEHDAGIGDTGSLRRFIDWAVSAGFAVVQLLPINETGGDNSPYNAISSMALDPAILDVTPDALPDLDDKSYRAAREKLANVSDDATVHYGQVKPWKQELLQAAFARFERKGKKSAGNAQRGEDFAQFCARNAGWLETYTLFRALMQQNGGTECWDRWPSDRQTAASASEWLKTLPPAKSKALAKSRRFFAYVQWIAYGQWEALKEYAGTRGVALMGDIPLGVSYYSADFFGEPELFEPGWSGGAPPEPYFKDNEFTQKWGQNWGIPVYDWSRMRQDNFRWWRQRVGGVRNIFHLFRIDHILGFYRIYSFPWRPELNAEFLPLSAEEAQARTGGRLPQFKPRSDDSWDERQANRAAGDELLRMVLAAAGATRLIGEDLGTVPDYVRPNLTELGIAGFKIPIWEPDPRTGGLLPGSEYARLSVATYGTHDHEPLMALWKRWEQLQPEERYELRRLAQFAGIPEHELGGGYQEAIYRRLLDALFRSNSWIAICMITDVFAREERFNVPGTATDSNWSRRMHITLETLRGDPDLQRHSASLRAMIEASGRAVPPTG